MSGRIRDKAYSKQIRDRYYARLKANGYKQHAIWVDDDTWNVIRNIRDSGKIKVFIPQDSVYAIKRAAIINDDEHGLLLYDKAEDKE